ncbi:hypothetical protein AAV97_15325 [Acinetobacter sp. Ag2]|uniref:toll/interleukin-1 receptor domain-containing protein n=1 Tax=Acinetobacter sp. Ag2 TaxID=1646532 RepID=UPI0006299001|nr:toll/interleukin-1 receptor domain-containing protein [Acinetobacter sp. Ag2]KKW76757.1 hypothetical protein AAV97_15325 [Acinetobacter sp. Ag2]
MIKCFLSHSSSDKSSYVRHIAEHLKRDSIVYDEMTFEPGMDPAEEILTNLEKSSLFVIFLSNESLNSNWVVKEIEIAKKLEELGSLKRIFPIIIDKNISYTDPRIPQWMKDTKNIQPILSHKVAIRRIKERIRELSKSIHPNLKDKDEIFVGRNDNEKQVEIRLDDFYKDPVICFIVSGLPGVGKKAFIRYVLKKANVIKSYYNFPMISLEFSNSIEDFILKIIDLGISDADKSINLLKMSMDDKINLAVSILKNFHKQNERIIIEDHSVIIQPSGSIAPWFEEIINKLKHTEYLTFCIVGKHRPYFSAIKSESFYSQDIPELSKSERSGLLKRYADFQELNLQRQDLMFFSEIFTGLPEQVFYAVDLIKNEGLFPAKKKSHSIQEFASNRAKVILADLDGFQDKLDLLYLISKFDFISYDFLFDIVDENQFYPILEEFLFSSICEKLGSNGDYIRVNDVIREYILRNKFDTNKEFNEKLMNHVWGLLKSDNLENTDLSDINFAIQIALSQGEKLPENLLIPSYFLKTIIKLYNTKGTANYRECIKLADRILESSQYMDELIIQKIYFIKCQTLARLKDKTPFFENVKNVKEPDRSFLYGFFYRLTGRPEQAIESYKRVLEKKPNDLRVQAELVLVYMQKDMHDEASSLAERIYNKYSNNVVHINNFLSCLLHKKKQDIDFLKIDKIIGELDAIDSDRAKEMSASAKAQVLAKKGKFADAYEILKQTILEFPDITYPKLTLADLAIQERNIIQLSEAIDLLEKNSTKYDQNHRSYIRYKAILLTLNGNFNDAVQLVERELKDNTSNQYINEILTKVEAFKI